MKDSTSAAFQIVAPKKLIEVTLPLDEINKASAREKSIRHGHPSTLHLWWSRKPLAATRAVLFAQIVNDPSWKYTEEELKKPQIKSAITRKRNELFKLITQLVQWENTNNEEVLGKARAAIRESWRETCEANKHHPDARNQFDPDKLPPFHDPFAGGGSIPLEAQRLGLEAHATDLNPVAVLINKAMIEIPPQFAGCAPMGPPPLEERQTKSKETEAWSGARGLAEDICRYGAWLREEAWKRLGHSYPTVKITKEVLKNRPELMKYEGKELTVIAWIWARTVVSPNPSARGARVPLVGSFWLSKKPHRAAWIRPSVTSNNQLKFEVVVGAGGPEISGTIEKSGATCIVSKTLIPFKYIRDEAKAGRMTHSLMAIVAEGDRERVYLAADPKHERIALDIDAPFLPELPLPESALGFRVQEYGIKKWSQLFSRRQQNLLKTCIDIVKELPIKSEIPTKSDELTYTASFARYRDAVTLYLSFLIDKLAESSSTACTWSAAPKNELVVSTFRRYSLSQTWEFAESNPFADSSGSIAKIAMAIGKAIQELPTRGRGRAGQHAAQSKWQFESSIISTDPPYFDNIGYADLSDFFYYWLRQSLSSLHWPEMETLLVPKEQELIASPYRHESAADADQYFLTGMTHTLRELSNASVAGMPLTLYYAFKQSDADNESGGVSSTGWESFLGAIIASGLAVTATWPIRTERSGRSRDIGSNALASSIVLCCRKRSNAASVVSRRDFFRELEKSLPGALGEMMEDPYASIAPVDLAQAAIGPGMAIFSKYNSVLEADGSPMSVQSALIHINKAIDDYFAHAEGGMDADTRFCIGWFQQYEFEEGPFGEADVLARAKGTAVDGVRDAGVIQASKGKVRLLRVKEYPESWDPTKDSRVPVWEACHQLCRALGESESEAGALLARMPEKQDDIRQLAYRLYTICERKGWAEDARAYNDLVTSWPAIVEESLKAGHKGSQMSLL